MTMGAGRDAVITAIQGLWDSGSAAGLGEADLLSRFASRRDEAAFAALVSRHEPLVFGVCRRVLGEVHAAEDASQATFLVLARKAGSIDAPERLEAWLHGVALRTSRKAKAVAARRRERETAAGAASDRVRTPDPAPDDIRPVIDEELARLPQKYRAPVLLCDLGGRSIDEAAKVLGWPRGTVGTRLVKARAILKTRLGDETLKLAWIENGGEATPAGFDARPQPPAYLAVLQLVPKEKAPEVDPATAQAEEEEMARREGNRNLRLIALAMYNYHNEAEKNHLPPAAVRSVGGKPLLSWRVILLPLLGQQELYDEFHLDEPWDSPHNKPLLAKMPKVFAPRDPTKVANATYYQVFVGPGTAFGLEGGVPLETITDGASNTIMVVQAGEPVPWTKPEDIPFTLDKPLLKVDGPLRGGFLAAMADGSVRFISNKAKAETIEAAIRRDEGRKFKPEDLDPEED